MANKYQGVISKYMNYYAEVTGKSSFEFMENRKKESDDWLAEHIDITLKNLGITEEDIQGYIDAVKRGYRSALSECMSTSPELCRKTWEYTHKYINNLSDYIIWDPACGNGRLEMPVENRSNLYLSTINNDDVIIAKEILDGATVFNNDFLKGVDYDNFNAYFSKGLPESLVAKLKNNEPIVFIVEPPTFITGNNDMKDMLKNEFDKYELENGILQYFKRIQTIIEFYELTNVYVVMVQFIERDSWLKKMLTDFKPLGGLCYEFNKVTHKYRAAIVWKYEPCDIESEEYKNRYTVSLDKYNISSENDIKFEKVFNFEIKVASKEYSRGNIIAYQTSDNCFTNIKSNSEEVENITALDIYNKLPICVMKHLINNGMLNKDDNIDTTMLDEQWYIDSIPLFLFSKYNSFVSKDGVKNTLFPLNAIKINGYIKDENILKSMEGSNDTNIAGLDLVANNYNKLSTVAKTFMDYCIKLIVDSYAPGVRRDMEYVDDTVNWDAGIPQIRKLSNIWTVEVEDRYNKLQNDLVMFLAQNIMNRD